MPARLNINTSELPQPHTLNDVVCLFLAGRGRREEAYVRLRSIIKDATFAPPQALRHLAAITDFDLFVSTTFDSLLETAINLERFGGAQSTDVVSYSPNRVADLPAERDQLQRPLVYHLFGKMSASPTYVISDEDLLEFICALQSEHLAPEKLFHELEHNHLLFIGSNFTNWLARLFLRMAKRQRLSDPRDVGEVLADDHTSQDDRLVRLPAAGERAHPRLRRAPTASSRSCIRAGRRVASPPPAASGAPTRFLPPTREMPDNAVFISYAREDLAAVQQLKAGLERPASPRGSTWSASRSATTTTARSSATSRAARISSRWSRPTTQRRLEAYFRREWSYAIDRARNMADGALFILPVSIDDHDRGRSAGARQIQGAALHAAAGRAGAAGVRARACADFTQARR